MNTADNDEPLWKILEEKFNNSSPWEETWSYEEGVRRDRAREFRLISEWIRENHFESQGIIAVGAREVADHLDKEALRAESNEN